MNFKAVLITVWIWFPALTTAYKAESAKLLNEPLNTNVDPCTDFYSYVCGPWERNHPLTSGSGSYDVYQEISKDIPETLSYILGNRTVVETNQTIVDKVAIMYNACLALPDSSAALKKVLDGSGFNTWPILTEQNVFNSSNCSDLLQHMSISAILYLRVTNMRIYASNPANPYVMTLEPMPVQEEIKKVKNIGEVINNTIKLLNPEINSSTLDNLTKQLVQFCEKLSSITKDGLHDKYSIKSLESQYPNIPISVLLEKEFRKANITWSNAQVSVYFPYYSNLNDLLATANPNTLYNYAGFLTMYPYIEYVSTSIGDVISSEPIQSETKSRSWSECIALLDKNTPDILDYLYVTNFTDPAIKSEVENIARRLKQAFNETLQNSSSIGDELRQALQKKLKEVPLQIGYPDALLNMSVLETRYQYVPFFPSNISFTEALYHIKENAYNMRLRKLLYPFEGDLGWDHSPRDGRTFHHKYGFKIEIPYELFVTPFFNQGLPR